MAKKEQTKKEGSAIEIRPVKVQPNHAEFVVVGQRHTLPNLLRSYILQDPAVEFVSYKLEHPFDKDSVFVVRTKGKPVYSVIEAACKRIGKDLESFEGLVKKAVK